MFIEPMAELECALVEAVISKLLRTDMHDELCKQVEFYQANVVVLNGIDRLCGGNQADPHHRAEFIAAVKCALSRTGAAGIVVAPETVETAPTPRSKKYPYGRAIPGGVWSGLCHAHLHFAAKAPDNLAGEVPDERDEGEPRTDLRYLFNLRTTRIVNRICTMVHDDSVYSVVNHKTVDNTVLYEHCKRIVIEGFRKIRDMQIDTVEGKTSVDYLPKKIIEFELNEGLSMEDLAQMMRRLIGSSVFNIGVGQYPNRNPRKILVLREDVL